MAGGVGDRPILSFDIDGVLARPPLNQDLTMNRDVGMAPAPGGKGPVGAPDLVRPAGPASAWDRLLMGSFYRVRYLRRGAMPGAAEVVRAATVSYRVIALSARDWRGRESTLDWLERHEILPQLDLVVLNDSARFGRRLSSARFKERACARLGVRRHVDDDAATAALLARSGVAVDLIDWPRSRGLAFPAGVRRWDDLAALRAALAKEG